MTPPRSAMEATREYARRLKERFGSRLRWVRLYGSQARGEARETSDLDVLAVVADLSWPEKVEAIDLAFEVSLRHRIHVSPVVMSESDFDRLVALESAFAESVLREGIAA